MSNPPQTQINNREAHRLGGVDVAKRSGEDFGLFCKRRNCTFSSVLLLPTLLHV